MKILPILAILILSGCATWDSLYGTRPLLDSIEIGTSQAEVSEKIGKPLRISERSEYGEVWDYKPDDGKEIYRFFFTNGVLKKVVIEEIQNTEVYIWR